MEPHLNRAFGQIQSLGDLRLGQIVGVAQTHEIAIVGLPDARTGERACAVIVPKASCRPGVESIRDFLADYGVAKFKAPEQVVIAESLPKNDAGKVLKHQIRAELAKAE